MWKSLAHMHTTEGHVDLHSELPIFAPLRGLVTSVNKVKDAVKMLFYSDMMRRTFSLCRTVPAREQVVGEWRHLCGCAED